MTNYDRIRRLQYMVVALRAWICVRILEGHLFWSCRLHRLLPDPVHSTGRMCWNLVYVELYSWA